MQISKIEPAGTAEIGGTVERLVGVTGVEPVTSSLSGTRSNQLSYTPGCVGGGNGIRTRDFQLAKLALYQLSYAPVGCGPGPDTAQFASDAYDSRPFMSLLSKQKRCGKYTDLCQVVF